MRCGGPQELCSPSQLPPLPPAWTRRAAWLPFAAVSAAELTVTGRRARRVLEAINLATYLRISWAFQWSDGLSIYRRLAA